MSIKVEVDWVELELSDSSVVCEETDAAAADKDGKTKKKNAAGGKEAANQQQIVARKDAADCFVRCFWLNKQEELFRGWKECSKRWRNTHPKVGELTYRSARYCYRESGELRALTDGMMCDLLQNQLVVEVYSGSGSQEPGEEGYGPWIARKMFPTASLLNGDRIVAPKVEFEVAEGSGLARMTGLVKIVPSDNLVDFLLGGHVFSLIDLSIVHVPESIKDRFEMEAKKLVLGDDDDEQKQEQKEDDRKLSEDQIKALNEAITQSVQRANIKFELEVKLPIRRVEITKEDEVVVEGKTCDEEKEGKEEEKEFESNEEETDQKDEGEEKKPEFETEFITYRVENLKLNFDQEAGEWQVLENDKNVLQSAWFLSKQTGRDVAKKVLDDSSELDWTNVCLVFQEMGKSEEELAQIQQQQDAKQQKKKQQEPVAAETAYIPFVSEESLNLANLVSCGVSSLDAKSNHCAFSLNVNPPLFEERAKGPGDEHLAFRHIASHGKISSTAVLDEQKLLKPNVAKEKLFELLGRIRVGDGSRKVDDLRLLLIKAAQNDRELCDEIARGNFDVEEVCAKLCVDLNPRVFFNNDKDYAGTSDLKTLMKIAQEAELVGDFDRCSDIWCKALQLEHSQNHHHQNHRSYEALVGYAQFAIRSGEIYLAMELLDRAMKIESCSKTHPSREFNVVQLMHTAKRISDVEDSPQVLFAICKFQLGCLDALDFSIVDNTLSSQVISSHLRKFASFAMDLNAKESARRAMVLANATDVVPLIDNEYAENEILRARFKLLDNKISTARAILEPLLEEENENISSHSITDLNQATIMYLIGRTYQMQKDHQLARNMYSSALRIFSTIKPSRKSGCLRIDITYHLGKLTLEGKDYRKARVIYRNAIGLTPEKGCLQWAWLGLGISNMYLEDYDLADEALQKMVRLDGHNPTAWGYFACLQLRRGNTKEAKTSFRLALDNGLHSEEILQQIVQHGKDDNQLQQLARARLEMSIL